MSTYAGRRSNDPSDIVSDEVAAGPCAAVGLVGYLEPMRAMQVTGRKRRRHGSTGMLACKLPKPGQA